eukprot:2504971-Heterocapsa_arctica.AAC.1
MIIDTGCRRSVAGTKWHERTQRHLEKNGLKAVQKDIDEKFRFGDDEVLAACTAWAYPIGIGGMHGEIEIAHILVDDCPGLLSQDAARSLRLVLNLAEMTLDVTKAGIIGQPIEIGTSGHTMIDLMQFDENVSLPPKFFKNNYD